MKTHDLTKGNVFKVLVALALPIMGGSLLQFSYSLIDMLFVGRLGSDALASVGSSSFFIGLGHAMSAMAIIGGGIKVAHSIGKNDEKALRGYMNAALILMGTLGVIYATVLLVFGRSFIGFLEIDNLVVEQDAYVYLAWSAPTLIFAFYNSLFARFLGSFGNNKESFKISAVGIIFNIILDPIFIYGLGMGVAGAAIATLIANMISFTLYVYKGRKIIYYDRKTKATKEEYKEIVRLGLPMAMQRVLFTIVNIILAKIIAMFGADAIAAQKIGLQIESVTFMVIGGLNGAVAGFTGQNYGAKEYDRIDEGYKKALLIGIPYAMFTSSMFWLIPALIVRLFIDDVHTIDIAVNYLRILAFSQFFSATEMISNGLFTGIGMPKIPAKISMTFTILRIPMALILTSLIGINGVWWSISLSSILKGTVAYICYRVKVKGRYAHD